ncbi:MAG: carboxypeptidase regulatory-like domain-containing protein [Candidatus Eremiobacteraeota bacterium]|nr:carboxypeptidase regulatory-like domain-containing protein [Candidatus Eremiobacteraeota bacterium]
MTRRASALAVLASLAVLCCMTFVYRAALADGNTGTVRGFVTFGDRTPVCGALVVLSSPREPTLTTWTGRDGSYVFLAVFPGDVTVQLAPVDYTSYSGPAEELRTSRRVHVSPNLVSEANRDHVRMGWMSTSPVSPQAARKCPRPSFAGYYDYGHAHYASLKRTFGYWPELDPS